MLLLSSLPPPFGTSGKKGWSGTELSGVEGGDGEDSDSSGGGGVEFSGYNGWCRILRLLLLTLAAAGLWTRLSVVVPLEWAAVNTDWTNEMINTMIKV